MQNSERGFSKLLIAPRYCLPPISDSLHSCQSIAENNQLSEDPFGVLAWSGLHPAGLYRTPAYLD